jgi:hypothetical protein
MDNTKDIEAWAMEADDRTIVHVLVLRQRLGEEGERGYLEVPELQEADRRWCLGCLVRVLFQLQYFAIQGAR